MNESAQISITEISEALKKNPNLFKARLALAELYAKKGDLQQSLDELDKILSKQGDTSELKKVTGKDADYIKVRVLRIAVLMKMNKPQEALEDAKLLTTLQPSEPAHSFRLAEIYYSLKKFDDALPLYEKLRKDKPESVQLLNRIVGVFMLKKNYEKALEEVDAFLAKFPDNGSAVLIKAKIYLSQKHIDLAENVLVPEADKGKDAGAIVMLAELYRNKKDNENAVKYYKKALELVPENVGIRMKLADLYLQTGQNAEAIDSYENVLKKKSDFLPAMNNLAFLYSEKGGNLDRALELANDVARQLPENPDVADTLGWIHVLRKVYSQAEPPLRLALKAKPDNPVIMYHMGMLRYGQKDQQEAEELLKAAVAKGLSGNALADAQNTLSAITRSNVKIIAAKTQKDQGNTAKAITMLEEIQNNEGFNRKAAAYLGMLYAEQNKDITVALDLAQKAYDTEPDNPLMADALGWVYYYQGSLLMAKQYIEQAIEKDGKYGPAHVHLGAVYLRKDDPDNAGKEFEKAKTMNLPEADKKLMEKLLSESGK